VPKPCACQRISDVCIVAVSEIAIEYCAVPPHMAIGTMCRPSTTKEEDGIKGNWVRVEGNLNAQTSILFLVSLPQLGCNAEADRRHPIYSTSGIAAPVASTFLSSPISPSSPPINLPRLSPRIGTKSPAPSATRSCGHPPSIYGTTPNDLGW
jgi:hypothetical protein